MNSPLYSIYHRAVAKYIHEQDIITSFGPIDVLDQIASTVNPVEMNSAKPLHSGDWETHYHTDDEYGDSTRLYHIDETSC